MGEAPLKAPSSREVSFEPQGTQAEESGMEKAGDDISADGQPQTEDDPFNPIMAPQGVHSTKETTSGIQRSAKGKESQGRSKPAFERTTSPTRGSSQSQSASPTKKPSEPCHMKRGTYSEKRTATGANPNDSDDFSGEQSNNQDDDGSDRARKSDQGRRPDQDEEADETDRSAREITASMAEWETVTAHKQMIRKKTTQATKARGLAKIEDPENCDGKSQKCRDPITFDQWGQRIIKWLHWQEYDIRSEEALYRASFLLTDNAGIWYDEYQRERKPKNRNTYSFLCLLRNKLIIKISKDVLWNEYHGCHHAQRVEPGKPAPINQYAEKLEE